VLASVGSVGDAYDNALAESFVDSFKTELIADRVWRTRSQLELAVVEYIGWFNHTRLHESLGDLPPAEFEAQAPRAQAAPKAGERPTLDGRPLRLPLASEILISRKEQPTKPGLRGSQPRSVRRGDVCADGARGSAALGLGVSARVDARWAAQEHRADGGAAGGRR
jgi:hypothetical protein